MNLYQALAIADGVTEASDERQLEAWQLLINSGRIHLLPGRYARRAQELIDEGLLDPPEENRV